MRIRKFTHHSPVNVLHLHNFDLHGKRWYRLQCYITGWVVVVDVGTIVDYVS